MLAHLKDIGAHRTEFARLPGSGCVSPPDLEAAFSALLSATLRRLAVEEGRRCDGRGAIDVRPTHCELDSVPVVHGSALFSRGETQSLCTATVGRRGEQQRMESLLGGEASKRLFVNYAFPAFAIGDTSVGALPLRCPAGRPRVMVGRRVRYKCRQAGLLQECCAAPEIPPLPPPHRGALPTARRPAARDGAL